jgi:hypothetical protein
MNLEEAVTTLKSDFPHHQFNLNKIHINTIDKAFKEKFISSPTIRVNGKDLPIEFKESNCDSCGDFCGDSVDCRIWVYEGKEFESAPTEMLVNLISDYIHGKINLTEMDAHYSLPENIVHFFSAKLNKENPVWEELGGCGCGANQFPKETSGCCGASATTNKRNTNVNSGCC